MVSRTLYRSLPLYSQWFDEQSGSILAHLCGSIQPELDLIEQILGEYEFFLSLDSPLNDEYLDFLQQFVGAAPIEGRYLGIGLDPSWSVPQKKRVISRLFQYWQSKGTESAMRLAITLWLEWPEAESPEALDIRYPFGSQISSEPDNWWQWGTLYDAGCYQSYKDSQVFGGGDIPGFNYQPPGLRLREFVDRWQWSVEVWSPRLLDPLTFPIVKNSRNYLGPNNIGLHFNPSLDEFPTWNQIFNNYSILSTEIIPVQTSDLVFQWVEPSVEIPVIGLDPSDNLVKRTNYELEGYNWGGLDLWPFPGLSQRTIKEIEIENHEYFFPGWQWREDLFPGESSISGRVDQYEEVEVIVEGSWGTRYGDLSAMIPFYHWQIVDFEIITPDNYSDSILFWIDGWNQVRQWFYSAKIEIIKAKVNAGIEPVDLVGTLYPFFETVTHQTQIWRDIPTGLSSEIQLWGSSLNQPLSLPHSDYTKVPVLQSEDGLNFLINDKPLTVFYFGSKISQTEEILVLRAYNFLGHTEFRNVLEPVYKESFIPPELWGSQFLEIVPVPILNLEQQIEEIIDQQSNSSVLISWGELGTGLQPSSQPWAWIFNHFESTEIPPITTNIPGLDIDSAADYLSWDRMWYFPSQTQIIYPPENTEDSTVGDYPFIFNQGYQWPSFLSRQKVKNNILQEPTTSLITQPSIQWFYPPVDRVVSHEWVEILNPINRTEEQPRVPLSSTIAENWNSGIAWIYQNSQGRILDRIETSSETSFIEAQPWVYSYRRWVEFVLIEEEDGLEPYSTPAVDWYVHREWQERVEVVVSEINTDQCFLGKNYNLQTSEIVTETEDLDSFLNIILRSEQTTHPDQVIRPAFAGIFPGSQWLNLWLQLEDSSVALLEIDIDFVTESFGEIDLEDWEQETLTVDLGTVFENLVYSLDKVNSQEKIDLSLHTWYSKERQAIIIPGGSVTTLRFEKNNCAQYYDNWLTTCFWAKLNNNPVINLDRQPIYSVLPLCNIPFFFSDRTISNLEEEWITLDPDLTLFEEFPNFSDWFLAENWNLLIETQGEVFKKSPLKVLWDKDNAKSVYYTPEAKLLLEFVFSVKENLDQIQSATVRSVALLFQDRCVHFQTCELHGKLNTRSDYLFGVRYQIIPKFQRENYITVDVEILI